ncbi:MAG TPA: hypothetical protein PLM33_02030, partial [Acidobacteriota bacterium]|nr:hypothetical protein [Acidobacteriota bacterium]
MAGNRFEGGLTLPTSPGTARLLWGFGGSGWGSDGNVPAAGGRWKAVAIRRRVIRFLRLGFRF